MRNLLDIVGTKVRRITFSLHKDGEYYVLFSVIEQLLPDMQDYKEYDSEKPFKKRANYTIKDCNDKIYFTIDYFQITEEFIDNPTENYVVFGTTFKFFSDSLVKSPASFNQSWLPSEGTELDLIKCLPLRQCARSLNCWIDSRRRAQNVVMSNSHFVKQLSQLSADVYGIDLTDYSDFLGNIYCIRYNPYFKTIDWSVSNNPNGLFLTFQTWKQIDEILSIDIVNKNKKGLFEYKVTETIDTGQQNHFIKLPDFPGMLDVRITDSNGDLICVYDDMVFLHAISFDINIASKRLKIEKKDGSSETVDKYSSETSMIGSPIIDDLVVRSSKMDYEVLENNLDMVLFDGTVENVATNKAKAKKVVRRIIGSARKSCIIADPYFNLNDMVEYIFPMSQSNVAVRILSAQEYLADKHESAKTREAHIREAITIEAAIQDYKDRVGGEKIIFRLLKGKCPIHDRYIVADDTVWLVGTSLNEIGSRMSTIIKLPKQSSDKIIRILDSLWTNNKNSISVEDYVATSTSDN